MKRTPKYVGLDVHQATTVTAVVEESGRSIGGSVVPTEASALVDFCRGMRGPVHVALEEGTQAQWLHDLLTPIVAEAVVCDRRGQGAHGPKGDHQDAEQLAELLRQGALRPVYHGTAERAAVKELARTYQNLVEDGTRVMLPLKALFRARGIKTAGRSVYDPQQRRDWLQKLPEAGARFRAQTLYTELAVLQQLRPKAKAALLGEAHRDHAWAVLRTIPFLGVIPGRSSASSLPVLELVLVGQSAQIRYPLTEERCRISHASLVGHRSDLGQDVVEDKPAFTLPTLSSSSSQNYRRIEATA